MVPPPENMLPKDQDTPLGPKTNSSATRSPAAEQGIKCPRCDSANTKFCYYNNYSLTQPRHFCKTCRRYWTNGGALRNVPIGGGCRKNKKVKPSSSSSSSSSRFSCEFNLQGLSAPPNVEFNLGGLPFSSRLNTQHFTLSPTNVFNHFPSSFGDSSSVSAATNALSGFQLEPSAAPSSSLMGFVPPSPDLWGLGQTQSSTMTDPLITAMQPMQQQSMNVNTTLASSIESLSNINQDLHLKLQQQRLAMMYGGGSQKNDDNSGFENQKLMQQQPVKLVQNLEISKPENLPAGTSVNYGPSGVTTVPTEWFFGNSFPSVTHSAATNNLNDSGNGINDGNNNWGGALPWEDFQHQQYSALP